MPPFMIADMHAHNFLRPYQNKVNDLDTMSNDPNNDTSIWKRYEVPDFGFLKIFGGIANFTTYSESDFTRAINGPARLINVSLYAPEAGFFEFPNIQNLSTAILCFARSYLLIHFPRFFT